jgi:hypothetical protein
MRRSVATLLLGLSLSGAVMSTDALAQSADAFDFVAMGDMPYALPDDYVKVERLIAAINAAKPAFTLHVGDIKAGSTPCTNENFKKVFDQFTLFEGPLVYTPGDNEWTDCHREKAGKFDPLERLAAIRTMFFPVPGKSLGKAAMDVESQAKVMPGFGTFVENQRFTKNGVMVVMPHVVGSNNSFEAKDAKTAMEYFDRDKANQAWLTDSFKKAVETDAKAIVIAFQADPYATLDNEGNIPRASGFANTLATIAEGAKAFGNRPILLITGDNHVIEYKQVRGPDLKPIDGAFHLQLMGEAHVHAVRVTVDPAMPGVFGFVPMIIPENGVY